MDKMGRKIEEAHSEFEKLSTTRSRSLERPLSKIEEIRIDKQIETYQSIENGDEIKEIETSDA
jgi:DNA anti-recombination protein RmuC